MGTNLISDCLMDEGKTMTMIGYNDNIVNLQVWFFSGIIKLSHCHRWRTSIKLKIMYNSKTAEKRFPIVWLFPKHHHFLWGSPWIFIFGIFWFCLCVFFMFLGVSGLFLRVFGLFTTVFLCFGIFALLPIQAKKIPPKNWP